MRRLTRGVVRSLAPRYRGVLVWVLAAGTAIALAEAPARADAPPRQDVTLIAGKLAHHRLTNDLFHINGLWMRVEHGTVFHRWLLRASGREVAIAMTDNPSRFADLPDVRILSGRLIHQTVPSATPIVHIVFLTDSRTGTIGAVKFETKDRLIAALFDEWSDSEVSVVIDMR